MSGPRPRPALVRLARLGGLAVGLAATIVALVSSASAVAGPELVVSGAAPIAWSGPVTAPAVAMGSVRIAAVMAATYLLLAALVELGGGGVELIGQSDGADRRDARARWPAVRLPWATGVVRRVAGAGLAASLVGASIAHPVGATAPAPVVMRVVGGGPTPPPVMHVVAPSTPRATVRPDDPPRPAPGPPPSQPTSPPARPVSSQRPPARPGRDADGRVWTIRPGDHLWRVASRTLASSWGRPASDSAIAGYVDAIIATNRDVFVVRGDADLVYPGQQFVLPPVPSG